MGGDRSTELVPPTLGSMIDRQSGDQVGYIGPLHGQAGIPHPYLVRTGKVQEHGIQQNVQITKKVDHTLKNQLQFHLPTGASTRSSLPSCSRKSGELRIVLRCAREIHKKYVDYHRARRCQSTKPGYASNSILNHPEDLNEIGRTIRLYTSHCC